MIIRPAVFRFASASPFPAAERHYNVSFPFLWQELDDTTIELPEGFALEGPTVPSPNNAEILSESLELGYDSVHRTLHAVRRFKSDLLELPKKRYPALKTWYDNVAYDDRHCIVFRERNAPAGHPAGTVTTANHR